MFRAADRLCAFPVRHAREIMRTLPIEPMPGTPSFVIGAAMIRGRPTPVIDVGLMLGRAAEHRATRLISISVAPDRSVAVLADEVLGVVPRPTADDIPPLLGDAAADTIDTLARLDGELLTILRTGSLLPEEPS